MTLQIHIYLRNWPERHNSQSFKYLEEVQPFAIQSIELTKQIV